MSAPVRAGDCIVVQVEKQSLTPVVIGFVCSLLAGTGAVAAIVLWLFNHHGLVICG